MPREHTLAIAVQSSGVNSKRRRAAAGSRSSRRVRNSTRPSTIEIQPMDEATIATLLAKILHARASIRHTK